MAEQEPVPFILNSRQKGRADEQIKQALISVGWKKETIEQAFKRIMEIQEQQEQEEQPEKEESESQPQEQGPSQDEEPEEQVQQEKPGKVKEPEEQKPQEPKKEPEQMQKEQPEPQEQEAKPVQTPPKAEQPEMPHTPMPPVIPTQTLAKSPWPSEKAGNVPYEPTPQDTAKQSDDSTDNPAFSNLDNASEKEPPRKLHIILAVLAVFIVAAGAYYFLFLVPGASQQEFEKPEQTEPQIPMANESQEQEQKPAPGPEETPDQAGQMQGQPFDCGKEKSCFCTKALGCARTKAEITDTLAFGAEITTTTYMETKGIEGGKCILYRKILENDIHYPESLKAQLAASGQTPEQIAAAETEGKLQAAALEGRHSTCKYLLAEFDGMISGWAVGTFSISTQDWEKYECTGTLNDPISISQPEPEEQVQQEQPEPEEQEQPVQEPEEEPLPVPEPENQTEQNISFSHYKTYQSSRQYPLDEYCEMQGGLFYRAHYREYYGGECLSEKKIKGFANLSLFTSHCTAIPCCFQGPSSEYSIKYDYFECGFE